MTLRKDFYDFASFCEAIGADGEAVRQALARGDIDAYLHPKDELAQLRFYSFGGGVGMESGRNQHASWRFTERSESQFFHYRLTGWFRVDPESLRDAALKGGWRGADGYGVTPVRVVPPAEQDGELHDGDVWEFVQEIENEYEGSFWTSEEATYVPTLLDLWFSASTVERLKLEGVGAIATMPLTPNKALSTRERNNLLRVIAGLAAHAGIDLRGDKAVAPIVAAGKPFSGPDDKTVRKWIAQIRDEILPSDWRPD